MTQVLESLHKATPARNSLSCNSLNTAVAKALSIQAVKAAFQF